MEEEIVTPKKLRNKGGDDNDQMMRMQIKQKEEVVETIKEQVVETIETRREGKK